MHFERVYAIWDIYDGVRTGVADFDGAPHYFARQFDETADDYSGSFQLHAVSAEFLQRTLKHWEIYRAWEYKFNRGDVGLKAHPGHGGIHAEYDELQSWLDVEVARLSPLPADYEASFRVLPDQDDLPREVLRDMQVAWSKLSA